LEDVKIAQTRLNDLETQSQSRQTTFTTSVKKEIRHDYEDDANATALKQIQAQFTKTLNYVLQFLPPTAMRLIQVR
jgi:hypothetical protein